MEKQLFNFGKPKKGWLARKSKCCLAIILSVGLLLPYPSDIVRALMAEGENGTCPHHLIHTAECGYVEAVAGHPCNHVHDETCGYLIPTEENSEENSVNFEMNSEEKDKIASEKIENNQTAGNGEDPEENQTEEPDVTPYLDIANEETKEAEKTAKIDETAPVVLPGVCNHVHDEACGYVAAVEGHPCEFVCEICNPEQVEAIAIQNWQWVDEEEYLVFDEDAQNWYLALPGASEENVVTPDILREFLPANLTVTLAEDKTENLPLSWDLSAFPEEGAWEGTFLLRADLPQGYCLAEEATALTVVLDLGGVQTFLTEAELEDHIVTEGVVNPAGVTVNLFDYWVNANGENPAAPNGDILTKNHNHYREKGSIAGFSNNNDWNRGINKGHLLLFGDGIIHGGLWNKGAGSSNTYGQQYAGMEGIVKPVLAGGYPEINLANAKKQLTGNQTERDWTKILDWLLAGDHKGAAAVAGQTYPYEGDTPQNLSNTLIGIWEKETEQSIDDMDAKESLDYLFNPSTNHANKKSYENVTGLFQLDEQGYYTYSMRNNFAEFVYEPVGRDMEASDGHFVLYDAPGTFQSNGNTIDTADHGNFFPFNKGTEVFTDIVDGQLVSNTRCFGNVTNHHFGMTIDMAMRQPIGGMINMGSENNPMVFQFAGDDDVWIFIDDVLVLDLGGVHSEIYGTIDFSTGAVNIGRSFGTGIGGGIPDNPADPSRVVTQTTLKEIFTAAGREDTVSWNGNTFSSNTDHHLRMFYLERGNYDSSLTLRFNIQPLLYQQIKKVDKLGNPLAGVEFKLYEAKENNGSYTAVGDVLATLTTDVDGVALFTSNVMRKDGAGRVMYEPFNFNDRENPYYILKESNTLDGYRGLPIDIVLEYNPKTTMLRVVNRWTTGAYSSFTSTVAGNKNVTYGHYNADTGDIDADTDKLVPLSKQRDGLVVAIPMMLQEGSRLWQAVHGSNTYGFSLVRVDPDHYNVDEWRKATLTAAIYQCGEYGGTTPGWYLDWSAENYRLEGTLTDLPGRADRYKLSNPDTYDMMMVYGIIEPDAFAALGITANNSGARYEALGAYIHNLTTQLKTANPALTLEEAFDMAVKQTVEQIMAVEVTGTGSNKGFSFLNVSQFNRNFRSMIYIPNEQRELYVQKIDQNGRPINGAVFGLYADEECTGTPIASGRTARVNNQEGVLVFTPTIPAGERDGVGYAEMVWVNEIHDRAEPYFYLKEISAPAGYEVNPTITPVIVGIYSIYADAGVAGNGISVMAGVGKLMQTMVKFASDGEVNITLRDIEAIGQVQNSGEFAIDGWQDMKLNASAVSRTMNLHYGLNAVIDYGLHDEDGGQNINPFLVTDTGFIRVRVEQNYEKLFDEPSAALKDDLGDLDITSLFSLVNFVVVTDQTTTPTQTGHLTISKMLAGAGLQPDDYIKNFQFKLELTDEAGNDLTGEYYFYGTNKTGYVKNGDIIPLHHDESITVLGLPAGVKFKVTEETAAGWHVFPKSGVVENTILANQTAVAAFSNSKEPWPEIGAISISKTVTGSGGDKAKEFTFAITLTDKDGTELTDRFDYIGSKTGTIASGETVQLKHGESITLQKIPAGSKYFVVEKEANLDRYQTEANGDSGVIEDGVTGMVVFHNHKESDKPGRPKPTNPDEPEDPKKPDDPGNSSDPTPSDDPSKPDEKDHPNPNKPDNSNHSSSSDNSQVSDSGKSDSTLTPKTGDNQLTGLWAALCAGALLAVLVLLYKKPGRKYEK